jgi:hypothetical protein
MLRLMRLMIIAFVLATLVIIDYSRFHGYYTNEAADLVERYARKLLN